MNRDVCSDEKESVENVPIAMVHSPTAPHASHTCLFVEDVRSIGYKHSGRAGVSSGPMSVRNPLTIGLVYDLLGSYPRRPEDPIDVDAEYEPETTVAVLERAIEVLGHRSVRIGNPFDLLERAGKGDLSGIDAAFNIAEGRGSRNREAFAPVLLEMAGIPALGSDALTLSLTLDKAWTQKIVRAAGVSTPAFAVVSCAEPAQEIPLPAPFPLFVKPRWEGTSKGIRLTSVVNDRAELAKEVQRIATDYSQPALVEAFLPGPEYTVTAIGNDPPRALPVLQRALEETTRIGLHAIERHAPPAGQEAWRHCLPGELGGALEAKLVSLTLRVYDALECRDFARADFRLDAAGEPHFLEINPLPTFAEDGSFGILAELEGRRPEALLALVIEAGLDRLGLGGSPT